MLSSFLSAAALIHISSYVISNDNIVQVTKTGHVITEKDVNRVKH